jgi:two-component system OmpR family sensor kinase
MKKRRLLNLLPLGLGLLVAVVINQSQLPNPLFRILISLSSLLFFLGLLTSLFLLVAWLSRQAAERRNRQKIAQMQAETAEDRRRFLRRLDHELKNPLTAIRAGLANFANAPTPETRQAALATVEAQTIRLSRLTADLRKIAELEERPLDRTTVDLESLLREVIDLVRDRPGAGERQIRLIVPQAPWPMPAISGDWDLIFLAMYNLLDNAVKFCQPGATIEVRGREDGLFVMVEVADTGPGIAAGELPHVWEELYRGQHGRTVPGSGLGLAMVRAVVERHGGAISLDSKVDQGTVVTVRLPVEEPAA